MKLKIFICLLIICTFILGQQPAPMIENNVKFQPIVENETSPVDWYIRTIKVYYKDTIGFSPVYFRKGQPLDTRCTDLTNMTFISKGDSLTLTSVKQMSCQILARFNLNSYESNWLKSHIVDKIIIFNVETDNSYIIYVNDTKYFYNLLNKYNVKNF